MSKSTPSETATQWWGQVVQQGRRRVAVPLGAARSKPLKLGPEPPPVGAVVAVDKRPQDDGPRWQVVAWPDTARAEIYRLAASHGLGPGYPAAVDAEVAAWLERPGLDDPALVDRTDLPFVTIDNRGSRDLDQAMYLERVGDGVRLWYALADAAYYAPAGSALFAEALARGATFYLPGFAVPMLPSALSEGLVSLNPQVERRAILFVMTVDAQGLVVDTRVERARVRSRAKLTYSGVQAWFSSPESHPLPEAAGWLGLLQTFGERRQALARARGVVEYDRSDVNARYTDPDGTALTLEARAQNDVEGWNAECSILCNAEGARLLAQAGAAHVQPVFRVHGPPPASRLAELADTIDGVVTAHQLDRRAWAWAPEAKSLAEYMAGLPRDAEHADVRQGIQRQALVVNQRSVYSPDQAGHHALGLTAYARFSSPMREVVGIFTHKEAVEWLVGGGDSRADVALREEVVASGNQSKTLQRTLDKGVQKLAIDQLLRGDLALSAEARPARPGVVLGLAPSRLYVRLESPPVEVKIYLDALQAARNATYELAQGGAVLRPRGRKGTGAPRFRIGDRVHVQVLGYDAERGRWALDARPLGTPRPPTP